MLHARASARTVALVRIAVFGIWLVRIVPDCFACLGDFSPSLLSRLGVLRLVPRGAAPWLLDPRLLTASKIILVALLLLALAGVRPYHAFAVAATTLLTFYAGIIRGLVEPTHADIGLLLVTFVLALSPAADAYAWHARRPAVEPTAVYAAAMIVMTLSFLMTYCLVACQRLALSSPEIFLTPTMRHYVASDLLRPAHNPFLHGEWLLARPVGLWFLQAGFVLVTLFELLSPWCLIHTRLRHAWLAVMTVFHAGAYVFMDVLFLSNVLLFPLLLVDHRWTQSEGSATRFSARDRLW